MTADFAHLLAALRDIHAQNAILADFVGFPDDLRVQDMVARHCPCADAMRDDPVLTAAPHPLARAFYNAGPYAHWRETYAGKGLGRTFMDQFGCYCAIGEGGPWHSDKMAGFVMTMPPGLHYTWHENPAEEMYLVLAGSAVFHRAGEPDETLKEGEAVFHASSQPHAMTTTDLPVMAYVTWRNHLGIKPILSSHPREQSK